MMITRFLKSDALECAVARGLEEKYGRLFKAIGFCPEFDLRSDCTTFEIKVDATAVRTFNGCIEFWNTKKNQPSGIGATKAEYWVHCIPDGEDGLQCYVIPTATLLHEVIQSTGKKSGGDFSASEFALIPMIRMKEISVYEYIIRDEFIRLIKHW
jgi:hypothetical protein